METLIGIYSKGTKRKFLNKIGRPNKDPFMKYKEIDLFKELFANLKPMKCFEYGCGTSTPYYIDHLSPDAEWGSVEHHQGWFDKIKEQISRPNLSLYHVDVEGNNGVSLEEDEYAHFPKQFAPFDFILVDGINRENCADAAKEMLSERGVVLVQTVIVNVIINTLSNTSIGLFSKTSESKLVESAWHQTMLMSPN